VVFEEFNGSTAGISHGITFSSIGDRGAVFSSQNDTRIEYSFNNRFPRQGTLEFLIKVYSGYHYDNYIFYPSDTSAQIFGTDIPGGDVYWPGGMRIRVSRSGTIFWDTETKFGQPVTHDATVKNSPFRFGEWHTIGISYGSEGQYVMVDGALIYSDPSFTMAMSSAGNFNSPVDVPTIGQNVSGFWAYHRYDGGFNGIVGRFRASSAQRDWIIAAQSALRSKPSQERVAQTTPQNKTSLTLGNPSQGNWLSRSTENKKGLSLGANPTTGDRSSSVPTQPSLPPLLSANVSFSEPSGNSLLEADEQGKITIRVKNSGKGDAYGLTAKIEPNSYHGLSYSPTLDIGDVASGRIKTVELPVTALHDVLSEDVSLTLKFSEENGFEPTPTKIIFTTKAFVPPKLVVSDVGVEDADGGSIIQPGRVVSITARIQNTGSGEAKEVGASIKVGQNVYIAEGSNTDFSIGHLAPGESKDIKFSLYTNNRASDVPVYVDVTEHYGSYGLSSYKLPLVFNKPMAKLNEVVVQAKEQQTQSIELSKGLSIDVDSNIPQARQQNPNAVALILSISDYQVPGIPKVKYAKHDAEIVRQYLINALGFKPDNILPANSDEQLTYGRIQTYIQSILPSYLKPDGSSDLFIYYTGHGAPNLNSSDTYLVPADCDPNYVSDANAYAMKQFYMDIEKLNARHKTIVIDACFSGQAGNGEALIKNASAALLKINNPLIADPTTVIFQSSSASQVSNWYDEKRHGMFTYFFLKGLQGAADLDGDGRVTADELIRYVNDPNNGLPYYANRLYQRRQEAQLEGNGQTVIERIRK